MPRLIQNTLTPLWELSKIKGKDNVTADDRALEKGFVRVCENVDIDDQFSAARRFGVLQRLLTLPAHSGWAEGDLCYMVLDGDLIQLNTDWTLTTLIDSVGSSAMNFVKVGDRVFFSNYNQAGYIQDGKAYAFPESERAERQKMVGGDLIEYHDARLYVAQDTFIFRSIAGNPFEMDIKRDFNYLGGPIRMLKGVNGPSAESGMYVSAGDKCSYLSNLEPSLETAHHKPVLNLPALPGSGISLERYDLGRGELGKVCIWSTVRGIYMGLPGGYVKDLTSKHYKVEGIVEGYAFIKDHQGFRQYVYLGYADAGLGEASFEISEPVSKIHLTA